MDKGAPGDGRQDAVGLRGDYLIVLRHEEEIGSAGLLHLGPGAGIQIHVLVKSVLMGAHNRVQAHGVIQPCFDVPCTVGRGPVEIADADGQRLRAALEIRAHRRAEDAELILVRRFHPDDGIGAEHERTYI